MNKFAAYYTSMDSECPLQLPTDKKVVETPTSHLWFDEEGILCSIAKSNPRTLHNVKETCAVIRQMVGTKKVGLIVDTSKTKYYTIEMRNELSRTITKFIKAVAILPCTSTGEIMAAILFLRNKNLPAKIFGTLPEAKHWLKQYL